VPIASIEPIRAEDVERRGEGSESECYTPAVEKEGSIS
jgi:hypothetical protein